jgi:hypothetical protein
LSAAPFENCNQNITKPDNKLEKSNFVFKDLDNCLLLRNCFKLMIRLKTAMLATLLTSVLFLNSCRAKKVDCPAYGKTASLQLEKRS